MLPQKALSSTLDILLYNDYREAIEKGTQIVSDYLEIHKQDTESLKLEWAYKLDSKKKNAMIVQFKGAAIDCVYIPAMINDCPVTRICSDAFAPMNWNRKIVPEEVEMRRAIKRVVLPETIKKIDDRNCDIAGGLVSAKISFCRSQSRRPPARFCFSRSWGQVGGCSSSTALSWLK